MNEYVSRIHVVSINMSFASLIEVNSKCGAKNESSKREIESKKVDLDLLKTPFKSVVIVISKTKSYDNFHFVTWFDTLCLLRTN